jgi:amidohydrolase
MDRPATTLSGSPTRPTAAVRVSSDHLHDGEAESLAVVGRVIGELEGELVALRRDIHAHPELGNAELRTTRLIASRLSAAGLTPRLLSRTGLTCDIGVSTDTDGDGHAAAPSMVALRADIDALPVREETSLPFRSTVPGVAHACGHDMHTAMVLGAGLALHRAARDGVLPRPVRLIFQPAEEVMPGGSHDVIDAGGLDGVGEIYCVHVDPRLHVGQVGLKAGAITSASDRIVIRLTGDGGHTARPHLTQDLVHALGVMVSTLPGALSRRLDPRAGVSLVWGRVQAGHAANAIPSEGWAEGTIRCLDAGAWDLAPQLTTELAVELAKPYGVRAEVDVYRGTPPVMNDPHAIDVLRAATLDVLGPSGVAATEQSLGAEDFSWYLHHVPGALARLGVRPEGQDSMPDLHRPDFDPDERAIGIGARLLATTAVLAARRAHPGTVVGQSSDMR